MAWNYLLVKELAMDEQTLPGFVACLHDTHPDDLASIDDVFAAPWKHGGDEMSVTIQFKPAQTEDELEYPFIKTHAFKVHPASVPHKELIQHARRGSGYDGALDLTIEEFDRDSYKERLIRQAGSDEWVQHGMTWQRREEIKGADLVGELVKGTSINTEEYRAFLLHECHVRRYKCPMRGRGDVGVGYTYKFTEMTVSTACTVSCPCGKEKDITDYSTW